MKFPSKRVDIERFERNNPDIAVNVLYIESEEVNQEYISEHNMKRTKQVILMLISDEQGKSTKRHFVAVKSMSRLMREKSKNNGEKYCLNCLRSFTTIEARDSHQEDCINNKFCRVKMPKDDKCWISYDQDDHSKEVKMPFVIYADIECILSPVEEMYRDIKDKSVKERYKIKLQRMEQERNGKSYTLPTNEHIPCGFCLIYKIY